MKIAFKTFGCRANAADTENLHFEAEKRGYDIVAEDEVADAYIINSCTVTQAADKDARVQAGRFKRLNPAAFVGVVGCYAQVAKEELIRLPEVDFVIGTADKQGIFDRFSEAWQLGDAAAVGKDHVVDARGYLPTEFLGSTHARAPIKIQDGCNFKCSFCIIPTARGRSRSLKETDVVAQIEAARAQGYREVVLTGIHLAHYGWDHGTDLDQLIVRILAEVPEIRIRLSTLDPFEISEKLLGLFETESRVCPYLHIALQSGSDSVLAGMRRIYKARSFEDVTAKLAKLSRPPFIGLDVIVGFPGEGEAEFEETVRVLQSTYWTKLHVFPYSARSGTRAAEMQTSVTGAEKAARSLRLRAMSDARLKAFLSSKVGQVRDVLLERRSKDGTGWWGHTEDYIPTLTLAPEGSSRQIVRSKLVELRGDRMVTVPTTSPN